MYSDHATRECIEITCDYNNGVRLSWGGVRDSRAWDSKIISKTNKDRKLISIFLNFRHNRKKPSRTLESHALEFEPPVAATESSVSAFLVEIQTCCSKRRCWAKLHEHPLKIWSIHFNQGRGYALISKITKVGKYFIHYRVFAFFIIDWWPNLPYYVCLDDFTNLIR